MTLDPSVGPNDAGPPSDFFSEKEQRGTGSEHSSWSNNLHDSFCNPRHTLNRKQQKPTRPQIKQPTLYHHPTLILLFRFLIQDEMGLVFGKIVVETPKHEVVHSCPDYEIREYPPSVVAEVTYEPSQLGGDRDGGFMILANYIGALGQPQNAKPEKIAMTAPVITKTPSQSEKIAMTAPVITSGDSKATTMQFVLPAKYKTAEEAPKPLDERVVIKAEGERKYGVARFSWVATDKVVEERVEKLRRSLERDGYKVVGDFLLARYNPPWTLPPLRTNEVMLPIE